MNVLVSSRSWRNLFVWLVLLGFGLSFGLNYGVSNHTFYLLPAQHELHPELWSRDWAVTQTHHYHVVFARLATQMLSLMPSGWLLALANVATIASGMACIWGLLRALGSAERAWLALLVVVLIASGTRTDGPGMSYIFSTIFQPNTLGSVGLLAACWLVVAGQPLASGLALALTGALHANYLVLSIPVLTVAQLAQGRAGLVARLVRQLGPALLVLLVYLPTIRAMSSTPVVAEAQRVYQDIRSPHHYRIETFAAAFVPWVGWQIVGAGSILGVGLEKPSARRLLALLLGFWALILPSLFLAGMFVIRPLMQLYPWRLTVNCELLAQAAFAACLLKSVSSPSSGRLGKPALILLALGLVLVGIGALQSSKFLPFTVLLTGFGLILGSGRLLTVPGLAGRITAGLPAVLVIGIAIANASRLVQLFQRSSPLGGANAGLQELCRWTAAHTKTDDLLLTPPDDENIRFHCQRAIVVDWKTAPMAPAEVLDWYHRLEDVTGRKPLRSAADLQGYRALDAERLQRLRVRYHFDYVVAHRGAEPAIGSEPVFRGQSFVVYRLEPEH